MELRALKRQRGFTLVELAVAMAIVSVALVSTANLWLKATFADQTIMQRDDATMLIMQLLETQIRGVPYDHQVPTSGVDSHTGLHYAMTFAQVTPTLRQITLTITAPGATTPFDSVVTLVARETP